MPVLQVADIMPEVQDYVLQTHGTTYNPGLSRTFSFTISDSLNTTLCASISRAIIEILWGLNVNLEQSLISKRQLPPIPVFTAPRKVYSLHFRPKSSSKSCFAMLRAFRLDCSASSL